MILYSFRTVTLAVETEGEEPAAGLEPLLADLSFVRAQDAEQPPRLRLTIHHGANVSKVPPCARAVFQADGLTVFAHEDDCYVTDGGSLLHIRPPYEQAVAWLAPNFPDQPGLLRQQFWAFGLLKLLRSQGLYGLHAAGVITENDEGLLIVGASGSGKSTLTLGVVQNGWRYLSDDAVLLRQQPAGLEALALRRPFAISVRGATAPPEPVSPTAAQSPVSHKQRMNVEQSYPGQYRSACVPRILIFAHIVAQERSTLRALERKSAFQQLLAQSGPQLFDRVTMPSHLEVLNRLVHQATPCELLAGRDLYEQPGRLAALVAQWKKDNGAPHCRIHQPV
jgi:hypothetical protein